ncbi:561_t:CDS:2, partial [Dentiscutata erythropus]
LNPYNDDSFNHFQDELVNFWEFTSAIRFELAKVAIRIHRICVNSVFVERLWSSIGYLYTNRRNRLKPEKVLTIVQIKSDITYNQNIKDLQNKEKKVYQLHIATPIILEKSDNSNNNDNQGVNKESKSLKKNPNNYENKPNTKEDEEY